MLDKKGDKYMVKEYLYDRKNEKDNELEKCKEEYEKQLRSKKLIKERMNKIQNNGEITIEYFSPRSGNRSLREELDQLSRKLKSVNESLCDLENRLDFANDTIDMLEDKVDKLQETLNYFKELWNKFIKFLQDKFFSSNKYDDLIDELHKEEIIDDDDLER